MRPHDSEARRTEQQKPLPDFPPPSVWAFLESNRPRQPRYVDHILSLSELAEAVKENKQRRRRGKGSDLP
jgi:lipid A disaccharide synthetase